MLAATQIAVEDINADGGVMGRKVETVIRDSEFKPEVAKRKATELIEVEKAAFLVGAIVGFEGIAMAEVGCKNDVIVSFFGQNFLTVKGKMCKYQFGNNLTPYQTAAAAARFVDAAEDGQEVAHARQQLLVAADVRARVLARGQAGRRGVDGGDVGAARHPRLPALPAEGGGGQGRRRLHHHVGRRPGGVRQAGAGVRARQAVAGHPLHHRADLRGGGRRGRLRELLRRGCRGTGTSRTSTRRPRSTTTGTSRSASAPPAGTPRPPTPRCACSSRPRAR